MELIFLIDKHHGVTLDTDTVIQCGSIGELIERIDGLKKAA